MVCMHGCNLPLRDVRHSREISSGVSSILQLSLPGQRLWCDDGRVDSRGVHRKVAIHGASADRCDAEPGSCHLRLPADAGTAARIPSRPPDRTFSRTASARSRRTLAPRLAVCNWSYKYGSRGRVGAHVHAFCGNCGLCVCHYPRPVLRRHIFWFVALPRQKDQERSSQQVVIGLAGLFCACASAGLRHSLADFSCGSSGRWTPPFLHYRRLHHSDASGSIFPRRSQPRRTWLRDQHSRLFVRSSDHWFPATSPPAGEIALFPSPPPPLSLAIS